MNFIYVFKKEKKENQVPYEVYRLSVISSFTAKYKSMVNMLELW